jgi:lipopolysaccharide export system permease protein
MNLFEEINFFKDTNEKIFFPIYFTLLNLPTVLFEVFPFIFLISGILFFLEIFELGEIDVIKVFGLNNSDILKILSLVAFFIGIFFITIFYSFSTSLKFKYLETKNKFTKDDKYLAVITSNGLWIRDIIDKKINFINANKISEDYLLDISISQFNDNFEIIRIINAEKALIKNNIWVLNNVTFNFENKQKKFESLMFRVKF